MGLLIKQTPTFMYIRENPNEHWEGRLYPEFMLIKMGEADTYDPDWNDQFSKEEGEDK